MRTLSSRADVHHLARESRSSNLHGRCVEECVLFRDLESLLSRFRGEAASVSYSRDQDTEILPDEPLGHGKVSLILDESCVAVCNGISHVVAYRDRDIVVLLSVP